MSPQMGAYTRQDAVADIAAHNAAYNAHPILPRFIKQRTGVTLISLLAGSSTTRADVEKDYVRAGPIWLPAKCTLDRIGINVPGAGAAGAKARVGLYDDDGNCYPNDLLEDGGEVDCTGTGDLLATISQEVEAGLYWVVINTNDSTIDLDCINTVMADSLLGGSDPQYHGWIKAAAYGALPSTFPSGATQHYLVPYPRYRIASWS